MQAVTCLTRDSYLTHCFLQHLMGALSSLERTPEPEPVDKDFYSEFGNKTTGTLSSSNCRQAREASQHHSLLSLPGPHGLVHGSAFVSAVRGLPGLLAWGFVPHSCWGTSGPPGPVCSCRA